jgi:hypothetical protein
MRGEERRVGHTHTEKGRRERIKEKGGEVERKRRRDEDRVRW